MARAKSWTATSFGVEANIGKPQVAYRETMRIRWRVNHPRAAPTLNRSLNNQVAAVALVQEFAIAAGR